MTRHRLSTGIALVRLVWTYAAFRILKHLVPLETLARWAWREPSSPREPESDLAIARRTRKLSRLVDASGGCLPRSLLLYRELSRQGADPRLWIGFVGTGPSLAGHAWVVVNGEPLHEPAEILAELVPVCEFGPNGSVLSSEP